MRSKLEPLGSLALIELSLVSGFLYCSLLDDIIGPRRTFKATNLGASGFRLSKLARQARIYGYGFILFTERRRSSHPNKPKAAHSDAVEQFVLIALHPGRLQWTAETRGELQVAVMLIGEDNRHVFDRTDAEREDDDR